MTHVSRFPGNRPGEADESAPGSSISDSLGRLVAASQCMARSSRAYKPTKTVMTIFFIRSGVHTKSTRNDLGCRNLFPGPNLARPNVVDAANL